MIVVIVIITLRLLSITQRDITYYFKINASSIKIYTVCTRVLVYVYVKVSGKVLRDFDPKLSS